MSDDDFTYPDDVAYGVDGGNHGIYDGVIVWVLKDGRKVNRFRGDGSRREERVDALLATWREAAESQTKVESDSALTFRDE